MFLSRILRPKCA